MSLPINLTVHRNTREKRQRREAWAAAQGYIKALPKDLDGFVMVYFKETPSGGTEAWAKWHCRDSTDVFRLPEIARCEIQRSIK